jgi:addiction module HigA family antidote
VSTSNSITEGHSAPPIAPEASMAEYKAGPRKRAPTHPGAVLASALKASDLNANSAAPLIGTTKVTLGRIMSTEAPAPVTTEMALRLGTFFGNGPDLWADMQTDYDLWHAREKIAAELAKIEPLPKSA